MAEIDCSLLIYGLAVGLGAGLLGGLMAGLAGVGGGLIYVPVFYAFMPEQGDAMSPYVFASLVAIIITGFFSSRSHWRLGHIDPPSMQQLLPGLIIGAGVGLWSTLHIPAIWVLLALTALNAWVAFDYGRELASSRPGHQALMLSSGPIGYISGLLGIGGGTMLVPLLRRSLPLRHAVGTSAICGFVMALAAIVVNISLEHRWYDLLIAHSLFLPAAWLGVMLILPLSVNWAARLHERLDESILRIILKTLFTGLSISFLIAASISSA